jgi:hypothetical protein
LSEPAADRAQLIEQHRLSDALELDADWLADLGEIADALEGRGGHEDLTAYRAPLDPRREVHRGADHGVLRALLGADVAHDRLAGVNADPHLEARPAGRVLAVQRVHRALHRERRGGCALGVIGLIQRRAEHREDGVADELVDRAPV